MTVHLPYGTSAELRLEIPEERLLADWSSPAAPPVAELADAVQAALEAPLDYPPLAQAIVPGDHVTITLEESIPEIAEVAAGVISALLEGGVEPEAITVLHTLAARKTARELGEQLPLHAADKVVVRQHDAAEQNDLAFLGATKEGESIYVNRALTDADLVIPIGCATLNAAGPPRNCFSHLYPSFAGDEATNGAAANDPKSLQRFADQVGWMLGIRLIVQLVPARPAGVARVLVGDIDAIGPLAQSECEATWNLQAPGRASLAIVSVGGEQSWENLGLALAAVEPIVDVEEGAVLLCTQLDTPPDVKLRMLADAEGLDGLEEELASQNDPSITTLLRFAKALRRGSVYLLSGLDDATVEDLGLAPVAGEREVSRLAARYDSCIVLANSQFAELSVAQETRSEVHG